MEAMLYALATKFLDKTELRKVTEKINMALLGQLLIEDGIGKGEMIKLISLVMKKTRKCLRHLNSPSPSFMRGIRACFLRHFIP